MLMEKVSKNLKEEFNKQKTTSKMRKNKLEISNKTIILLTVNF